MKKLRSPLWMFLVKDVQLLEHDASSQYKFNRFWAWFWFWQMPLCFTLMVYFNHYWIEIFAIYVTEASLWANFATHFGAMSAALAAKNTSATVDNISDDVDEIHEVTDKVEDLL